MLFSIKNEGERHEKLQTTPRYTQEIAEAILKTRALRSLVDEPLKEPLKALRRLNKDFVTEKKRWGTGLPRFLWERANLFLDI